MPARFPVSDHCDGERFFNPTGRQAPPFRWLPKWWLQRLRGQGARRSVGMHFGTFQLTDEGMDEPLRELARAAACRRMPSPRSISARRGC